MQHQNRNQKPKLPVRRSSIARRDSARDVRNKYNTAPQENTSWGSVASWYDEYLQAENTYQAKVIAPNLLRVLGISQFNTSLRVLELGCGQGYFLKQILDSTAKSASAQLEGVDVAGELLDIARTELGSGVSLVHTPASKLTHLKDQSVDIVYSVLALQNMNDLDAVMSEVKRVLKPKGRVVAVLNHPAFRIPKQSDWYYSNDRKAQGRVVYTYMSDKKFAIDMHPGQSAAGLKKEETFSFHHPLQYYSKVFSKYGFCIVKIEEWLSHKESEEGPKKRAEDESRKEIPMFMMLEIRRFMD